jgi:hypothetical protein
MKKLTNFFARYRRIVRIIHRRGGMINELIKRKKKK